MAQLEEGATDGAEPRSLSTPPLTTVKPRALHPLPEHALVLQDTRSSADASNASEHIGDDQRQLPRRAPDEDAQAARDKLDRIAKAQQAKRNWAKSTGVTLVSKAFGRNDRRQRRRRHGLSSDEDDSEDESYDRHESRGNIEEVKLMITGNPVVGKVFGAAYRARGRFRGQTGSPEATPQTEEGHPRFSFSRPGSSLVKRFSRPPSATPPPPLADPNSSDNLSPTAEAPSRGSIDHNTGASDRPRSRARPTVGPELLVVDEEGQSHDAAAAPTQRSDALLNVPSSSRSSNTHTPSSILSSTSSNPDNASGLAPEQTRPRHDSSASIIGGPIHDEPDAHDHDTTRGAPSPAAASSASDESDDEGLEDSALASDSDQDGDDALNLNSISLDHGEALTKDQLKRRKKLIRREIRRRKANGEPVDDLIHLHGKIGQLGHKVSTRVSKGINYATSSGRNRRAMDRYSPHPTLSALQTSDLPRSTSQQSAGGATPFSAITPSLSRNSTQIGQRRESVATIASSRRSSLAAYEDDDDLRDGDGANSLRRNSMIDRSILSSRNSIRKYLHAPNVIKRRRQKKWEAEMDAMERAAEEEARRADPDAELDSMLAKYAQQQAPSDANKVKYEFDVLYENQRGLLVFGIPKFSPRTLFQWDPSPWTSSNGKKSAYNIANAQLPDPSWEWAYSEWYIDMTGDVDEAGWQYSGNFGRRFWPNVHFPHGRLGLPKTGADGIAEMNARLAEKDKKRQEKESTKEDGGFEAIKRSARARSSKWTGSPDAWTFVRRRRWIRLRRRKPLAGPTKHAEAVDTPGTAASPSHELRAPEEASKSPLFEGKEGLKPGQSDDELDAESSLDGSDESDSSCSEDDPMLYAPAYGRPSGFLPRRLPGHMANGSHPAKSRDPNTRRRAQKHAKEFTGSIRELKSLLPSIIAMDREARVSRAPTGLTASQSSYKWAMLKINKVDARNPFISWHFVKHRLQDQDMAFAATTLRSIERKFQQRQIAAIRKRGDLPADAQAASTTHPPIPSTFAAPTRSIRFDGLTPEADGVDNRASPGPVGNAGATSTANISRLQEPFASSPLEGRELTRGALVEINFARVLRVLRACKIDRQRMDLWKLWLGVVSLDTLMETARREDLVALGLLSPSSEHGADPALPAGALSPPMDAPHMSGGSSFRYRQRAERARARWRASVPTPDASDVWDVLERKLDDVLLLFEFQSNRAQFIRLLLAVHEKLHPDHVYRDHSLRANPIELSPAHIHGDAAEMGAPGVGGAFGSRLGGWKRAGLPRLEFYSDLQRILAAVPGNDASANAEYILSQPGHVEELEGVAMPLGHHSNAVVDQLEAEAEGEFLEHEIPGAAEEDEEVARLRSVAKDRLVGEGGSGRTSPVGRTPSVPLPYRHTPLAGRDWVSTRSEARVEEPVSVSPTLAPQQGSKIDPAIDAGKDTATPQPPTTAQKDLSNGASRSEAVPSPVPGRDNAPSTSITADVNPKDAIRQKQATPRPPIPVRSDSVSPQMGARDRF